MSTPRLVGEITLPASARTQTTTDSEPDPQGIARLLAKRSSNAAPDADPPPLEPDDVARLLTRRTTRTPDTDPSAPDDVGRLLFRRIASTDKES